jgi:hypothetical protein
MTLIRRIFADFLSCHYKKLKLEKIHSRKSVFKTKKIRENRLNPCHPCSYFVTWICNTTFVNKP